MVDVHDAIRKALEPLGYDVRGGEYGPDRNSRMYKLTVYATPIVPPEVSKAEQIAKLRAELEAAQLEEREAMAFLEQDNTRQRYAQAGCDVIDLCCDLGIDEDGYEPDGAEPLVVAEIAALLERVQRFERRAEQFETRRILEQRIKEWDGKAQSASERAYAAKRELVKLGAWKEGE